MDRRSLLDYLADNDAPEPTMDARQTTELLQQRLEELASKLAAARPDPPASEPARRRLSSEIESILNRTQVQSPPMHQEHLRKEAQPVRRQARIEVQSPPLAAELPVPRTERTGEFAKFVEAVHLIGQAASRFLQEPPRPAMRERPGPAEDTVRLTAALKETIAAFQAMTADLVNVAGEIRRAAETRPIEPPKALAGEPQAPSRRLSREDAELFRLQDDLEDLRERLGAITRRRSRDGY